MTGNWPVEGSWRCGECLTWEHLMAWAAALVEGPLGPDGQLTEYRYVEDCFIHDDSIHCTEHPSARIERFRDGQWQFWWTCPTCHGSEHVYERDSFSVMQQYRCPEGRHVEEGDPAWLGRFSPVSIHGEWRPVASEVLVS